MKSLRNLCKFELLVYLVMKSHLLFSLFLSDRMLPAIYDYTMSNAWRAWGNDSGADSNTLRRNLTKLLHVDSNLVKRMGATKVADILNKSIKEFGSEVAISLDHIKAERDGTDCPHCSKNMCNGGYIRFRMTGAEPQRQRYGPFVQEKVVNEIKRMYVSRTLLVSDDV